MKDQPRRVLVVAPTTRWSGHLLSWLGEAGYEVALVTTFRAAKARLRNAPDALITEVKLREYNGLHLALRAKGAGIPTAVVGDFDPIVESDTRDLGAEFVPAENAMRERILDLLEQLVAGGSSHPRVAGAATAASTAGVAPLGVVSSRMH